MGAWVLLSPLRMSSKKLTLFHQAVVRKSHCRLGPPGALICWEAHTALFLLQAPPSLLPRPGWQLSFWHKGDAGGSSTSQGGCWSSAKPGMLCACFTFPSALEGRAVAPKKGWEPVCGAAVWKAVDAPPSNYRSLQTARAAKSCPNPAGVAESYPRGIWEPLSQLCNNKVLPVNFTDIFFTGCVSCSVLRNGLLRDFPAGPHVHAWASSLLQK